MDKTTWIGVILGIIAVVLGMFLKGVGLGVLVNPAAVMIIIVGTVASVLIAFPVSEVKRIPKIMGVIFKERETLPMSQIISQFADWAQLARKEGLLSLEVRINEINDPFLKNGLSLAVDGQSADYIRDVLNEEIDAMEERHQSAAQIFSQAGTYAPH